MIWPTTPPTFGKTPAGPCVSTDRLRAGAEVLGVTFHLDAEGVTLDGTRFVSLLDADKYLQTVGAARQMGAWVDAAQIAVEERATASRHLAQVLAAAPETPLNTEARLLRVQREALRALSLE